MKKLTYSKPTQIPNQPFSKGLSILVEKKNLKHIFDSFYFSFQTGSHSEPLGRLELKLTEISGLCLPNAGIEGMFHHSQL